VRHGDDQWYDVVKWTHFAMVNAEELGVTKANVDDQMKSDNPDVRSACSAVEGKHGEALGLTNDWAYRIIKHVGNYGESSSATSVRARRSRSARPECAVDQGRAAIRTAGPLT
jgi:hypothetical protein